MTAPSIRGETGGTSRGPTAPGRRCGILARTDPRSRRAHAHSLLPLRSSPPSCRRLLHRGGNGCERRRRHDDLGRPRVAHARLLRSRGRDGDRVAADGLLRRARRARAPHAGHADGQCPRPIVVDEQGRARLRVRAAPGRQVPQRRRHDRRGREVLVRALSRRERGRCSSRRSPPSRSRTRRGSAFV